MADLLSVTANIIAVIHLTASAIKCIRDVRHASKDCSEILVEICATSGILFALRDSISQARDDQTWQATIQWLGVPNGPLARFKIALECLLSRVGPTNRPRKAGRILAWPFKKQEAKDLLDSIERQKSLFVLALQNDNLCVDTQITRELLPHC